MRGTSLTLAISLLGALAAAACNNSHDEHVAAKSAGSALGTEGAHEHGVVRLNIAIDGTVATFEFEAPGQTLFGFEGEAKTVAQREQMEAVLKQLRENIARLFAFDPSVGCLFEPPEVETTEEEEDHAGTEPHKEGEEHSEVTVRAEARCAKSPAGSELRLGLREQFPQLLHIDLQVLSEHAQTGQRIDGKTPTIRL
jgi:hypothetical protein